MNPKTLAEPGAASALEGVRPVLDEWMGTLAQVSNP